MLDLLGVHLRERFRCHTAILYGSRARDDQDCASDIDVIAFGDGGRTGHVAHLWENLFLDLFLYPSGTKPEQDWVRIHGGRVLFQRDGAGDEVLAAVADMVSSGPARLSPDDARTTRLWLEKMLARAEKGDAEGDHRRHWLLKELLDIHFLLRGRWYLGPKQSLNFLRHHHPEHFEVLRRAFAPGADLADIRAAVAMVNGPD